MGPRRARWRCCYGSGSRVGLLATVYLCLHSHLTQFRPGSGGTGELIGLVRN